MAKKCWRSVVGTVYYLHNGISLDKFAIGVPELTMIPLSHYLVYNIFLIKRGRWELEFGSVSCNWWFWVGNYYPPPPSPQRKYYYLFFISGLNLVMELLLVGGGFCIKKGFFFFLHFFGGKLSFWRVSRCAS